MKELPGYRHVTRPNYKPLTPEDVNTYRERIEATWEKDNEPRQDYMIFFNSTSRAFCSVCDCAVTIADSLNSAEFHHQGGRSSITVTCTLDQLQILKQAIKGCAVTDTALRCL